VGRVSWAVFSAFAGELRRGKHSEVHSLADPFAGANQSKVLTSFNVEHLKDGLHIATLPIPDSELKMIGLVAAHWGTFEVQMDKLIAAFLTALGRTDTDWKTQGFSRRKTLLVELVRDNLESTFPSASASYRKTMGDAASLYWRRNLVVHGQYRVKFPPAGSESPTFWAEGIYKSRNVRISIDVPTLDKLWHDIAHLTGALMATVRTHGRADDWPWTLPDTQLLRVYRETSHPWHPKCDMRTPQPQGPEGEGSTPYTPEAHPFPLPKKK
jgi:hypothetical protein